MTYPRMLIMSYATKQSLPLERKNHSCLMNHIDFATQKKPSIQRILQPLLMGHDTELPLPFLQDVLTYSPDIHHSYPQYSPG